MSRNDTLAGITRSSYNWWREPKVEAKRETWQSAMASCGKSIPRGLRREIREWLCKTEDSFLLIYGIKVLARLIRDVHPTPPTPARAALFRYILEKDEEESCPNSRAKRS